MVPSMKRSSLPKISPLMVIPWLTQAGALGETGGALAASARVEEGGLSVADCCLLSSGFFHIRHLHGAGSEAAELGPVGQAGGSVRSHDDSTAPQGCKAKRMVLAISCVPLRGKRNCLAAGKSPIRFGAAGLAARLPFFLFLNRDALQKMGVYFHLGCGHEAPFSGGDSYRCGVIAGNSCLRAARWRCARRRRWVLQSWGRPIGRASFGAFLGRGSGTR